MFAKAFWLSTAASIMIVASPATAQSTAPAAEQSDTSNMGDIIVSARKRQESLLKVPVVENVVTAQQIENYAITDFTDLTTKVPGLSMGGAVLAIGPQISLRGVGTATLDAGVDQSISLNLDGLSLTQGLAYTSGVFDLAQAEVLKGPQALFFGKNSPGGVIALRTADPGNELEVMGRLGYEFAARTARAEAILSGPITDTFGMRLAGMVSTQDGLFRNVAEVPAGLGLGSKTPKKDRLQQTDSYIFRTTAVWKPDPSFDARLKVNFVRDKTDGTGNENQIVSCPDGTGAVPGFGLPFFSPNENCKLDNKLSFVDLDPAAFPRVRNGGTPFIDIRQKFGTLEMNYRPADAVTLTSVTGYYNVKTDTFINGTQAGLAGPALYADNQFSREDFTQEFRLDTDFSGPINTTLGAFYQDGRVQNIVDLGGNTALGLPSYIGAGTQRIDIKAYSLFGQLRYKPVETIELAGGVRWTDEKRSMLAIRTANFGDSALLATPIVIPQPKLSASNFSPEATITYTPTNDFTVFASFKRGYKSGSYTITTPLSPGDDKSFGDEKVTGGELGIKTRLLDRQITANLAGYYYKYQGLQTGANAVAAGGVPVIITVNAGGAEVYGLDFDMNYRPAGISGLTLNFAANWNHARFTKLNNVPCYGGQTIELGCNTGPTVPDATVTPEGVRYTSQDLTGTRLVRAPEWQLTGGFNYELPVGNSYKLNLGADAQFSTSYPGALSLRKDVIQKSYATVNATVSFGREDGSWDFAVIGNNLTNKYTCGSHTTLNYANGQLLGGQNTGGHGFGPAGVDEITCVTRPGREVWVRLTVRPTSRR